MTKGFSLIDFIDRAEETLFYRRNIPNRLMNSLPQVVALQGQPGSYAGMFALAPSDRNKEFRTFTGEAIKSNAARLHIAGEETCRILRLMGTAIPETAAAYHRAIENMSVRIFETDKNMGTKTGIYCCGTCSCAFWRNLAAGSFDHQEERLGHGLQDLKQCRIGRGRWRRFPFYYTLLALSEIDHPAAHAEIAYALPLIERLVQCQDTASTFGRRREDLLARILSEV